MDCLTSKVLARIRSQEFLGAKICRLKPDKFCEQAMPQLIGIIKTLPFYYD